MKRWTRVALAGAAALAAAGCEHMSDEMSSLLLGGAVYAIEDGLRDQQCHDRHAGDPSARSLCEFRSDLDNDWDGEGWSD